LLLTRLTLGQIDACLDLLPKAIELAGARASEQEARFLQMLQALLRVCQAGDGRVRFDHILADLTPAEEQRLLKVVRSLGQLDPILSLLKTLSEARPDSGPVCEASTEAVLVKGKELVDRCAWTEAEILLRPLTRVQGTPRDGGRAALVAALNLLG